MAKKAKKSARGRKQDRARVAGGQDYEVRYTAKKTRKSASCREEGGKESRQQPEARCEGSKAETLGTKTHRYCWGLRYPAVRSGKC